MCAAILSIAALHEQGQHLVIKVMELTTHLRAYKSEGHNGFAPNNLLSDVYLI